MLDKIEDKYDLLVDLFINDFFGKKPFYQNRSKDYFFVDPDGKKALEDHVIRRTRFFSNSIVPWISMFHNKLNPTVVEIGSGTGAASVALASKYSQVFGYDIAQESTEIAKQRASILGIDNVEFEAIEAESIISKICLNHEQNKVDVVLLFATLEHQTIPERLNSIKGAWDILKPGGLMVIGDTPNRLAYLHGHTSRIPFFDMLPDELAIQIIDKSPNIPFKENVKRLIDSSESEKEKTDKVTNLLDRWGRGVSFHEFEVVLGDLRKLVVGHGFERPIYRAIPLAFEEKLLLNYIHKQLKNVPIGFARTSLYLILRKPEQMYSNKFQPEYNFDENFDINKVCIVS